MNVGILGLGEVGSALKVIISPHFTVFTRDLNHDEFQDQTIDILHVCIPYSDKFVSSLVAAIKELKPQLTIIHSTIKPGTTHEAYRQTNSNLVHSPIIGLHNAKTAGAFHHPQTLSFIDFISSAPKIIGPIDQTSYQLAHDHLTRVGLKVERFNSPLETEMAKILSTTYYGWNILFQKWVHQLCLQTDADFDQVYTRYNQHYNQVYHQSLPHVVRPVLSHHPGPIGGHCVLPNATILMDWLNDPLIDFFFKEHQRLVGLESKPSTDPKSTPDPTPNS